MKVAVIGGGIAGLAAAIALRLKNIEVEIFEQADSFQEVGAGLQISPNGSRIFKYLGLSVQHSFEPESVLMVDGASGREIFEIPLRESALSRWGSAFLHVHRHDLQAALVKRAIDVGGVIKMSQRIDTNTIAKIADDFDYVVGADGVRSEVRNFMFGTSKAQFSGNVAYRATVPLNNLKNPPPPKAVIWGSYRKHCVTTRISDGEVVNFVGINEESDWREAGWSHPIDPNLVAAKFADFHPSIREILGHAQSAKRWALLYHPNLRSFTKGNLVLIGDAAHPMLPSFAQGAVQALEDAYILAEVMSRGQFEDFNKIRKNRVKRVQTESRANLERYHYGAMRRLAFNNATRVMSNFTPSILLKSLDWAYAYDVKLAMQSYS